MRSTLMSAQRARRGRKSPGSCENVTLTHVRGPHKGPLAKRAEIGALVLCSRSQNYFSFGQSSAISRQLESEPVHSERGVLGTTVSGPRTSM